MVIGDLSSRNPNVLYELGIRQAFNLPATLIRDSKTPRIFDIQGLRDIEYDDGLRIDKINSTVEVLANTLKNNSQLKEGEVNSIIQLLGVKPASAPTIEVSKDTSLLLEAINNIGQRLSRLETEVNQSPLERNSDNWVPPARRVLGRTFFVNGKGYIIPEDANVSHPDYGDGIVRAIGRHDVTVAFENGDVVLFGPGHGKPTEDIEIINKR
jgi:hypothetical protein